MKLLGLSVIGICNSLITNLLVALFFKTYGPLWSFLVTPTFAELHVELTKNANVVSRFGKFCTTNSLYLAHIY